MLLGVKGTYIGPAVGGSFLVSYIVFIRALLDLV